MPALLPTSLRASKTDIRFPNPLAWFWNVGVVAVAALRLVKLLSHNKTDLVVTKGLYAHFSGGLACLLKRVRCIWHVQDFISERFGGIYRHLFGLAASMLPDEIVADGASIARQLPNGIRSRIHVVLNGVDVHTFQPCHDSSSVRQELGIPPDALVIGHAARLTPWKGQHHLLEAFAQIVAQYPCACLLLVGSPLFDNQSYERHLHQQTDDLGLTERVIFAGFRADLPQILNAMDIFAYPSVEKDTSPLSLLSALACGLPVVAFDIEGMCEVLGDTGILVPVRNEPKLADELGKLVCDPALRASMGEQSRATAMKRFSLEEHCTGMEAVFNSELG